jgi:hypothetical protein
MIESLYTKYFQKSRSFLYPALGIKRTAHFSPSGTYVAIEGLIEPEDTKLICAFKEDSTAGFKAFEEQMLLSNPLFFQVLQIQDYNLYVFDYQTYTEDWFTFLMGRYSKLSNVLKRAIKNYYGENSSEYKYIESYLFPDRYFENYAKLLDVEASVLKKVGELCDPCDLDKEKLKIPVDNLENLTKKSINL